MTTTSMLLGSILKSKETFAKMAGDSPPQGEKKSFHLTFWFGVQQCYLEQKWVFSAMMNSGNF